MTAALLLLAVALIAANGFFVGAEFAVLAARRARLEPLLPTSRRARTALRAIEQLPLMISGCQFGITLTSLGLGALGEPAVAELLTGPFEAAHLPHELVHPLSIAVALTLISVLHMLFGEMVPKNLALAGPERAALALAPPLMAFVQVFRPVIVTLTAAATGVLKLFRTEPISEIAQSCGMYTRVIFICRVVNSKSSRNEQFSTVAAIAPGTNAMSRAASRSVRVAAKSSESVPAQRSRI